MEDSFFEERDSDTPENIEPEKQAEVEVSADAGVEDSEKGEKTEATPAETVGEEDGRSQGYDPRIAAIEKGLAEERRKRQEAEERYLQLEQKLASPDKAKAAEDERERLEDAFHADPVGFLEDYGSKMEQNIRMNVSERLWRNAKPDFDEKLQAFKEAAKVSPHLIDEMKKSPDPGEVAYRQGAAFLEFKDVDSIDSYRERVREQVRKEERERLLSEFGEQRAMQATRDLPTTNVGVRQSGGADTRVDDSLESIFDGR
jgi:hypothetical protein